MAKSSSWWERGKTVPIYPLSILLPFFSFFFLLNFLVFPYFYFIVPSSLSWPTHMHTLSVFLPLCLPDFHPPSWTPVPGKGPQLILLLHCSFNFVSYNEHKMNTGGENWDSGQKVEEWAWAASLKGMLSSWLEPLFWGTWTFTMLIMDAVWADIRACEKSSPHLLSLVLGFLTLIAL